MDFINEYSIMNLAVEKKLEYVMQCSGVLFGIDHVALEMRSYQMDFRYYLVKHRSVRDLNKILICVAYRLKELHSLGYVHRDIKPDNVVLNLKPFSLKLIDFNRSYLLT